jgi:hypothetical protein
MLTNQKRENNTSDTLYNPQHLQSKYKYIGPSDDCIDYDEINEIKS